MTPLTTVVRRVRRARPTALVAAAWTVVALHRVRRTLQADGLGARIPAPPGLLPVGATRGVNAVLRRTGATCLEKAVVKQSWLSAHGYPVDVVIGVASQDAEVTAHAWLDGDIAADDARTYTEIHRIAPVIRPVHDVARPCPAGPRGSSR